MPNPLLLPALAAAAAQTSALPPPPPVTHHWGTMFVSPMGEPFRAPRGGDALEMWFVQADKNHDGYLSVDEMQADADRFFATLDTNHDGEIDPDEIDHYENVIAPEISSTPHFDVGDLDSGQRGGGHEGRGGGHGGHRGGAASSSWTQPREGDTRQGATRFGLLDLPEPVSSADTNFNRGVSRDEFRQAAIQRFGALDLDHNGRVSLAEFERMRPPASAQPKKPEGSGDIDTESVP